MPTATEQAHGATNEEERHEATLTATRAVVPVEETLMAHTTRRSDPRAAKVRDMSRSVLPSTARRSARANLTAVRRRHRRAVSARTQLIAGLPCHCAELDDLDLLRDCPRCDADPQQGATYPLVDHLDAVGVRRGHDKLGPLLRWGAHEVRGLGPDEAERHLRAVLPDGLIGHHAMNHLEFAGVVRSRWGWFDGPRPRYEREARERADRVALLGRVADTALDHGLLALFHEVVQRHALRSEHVRTRRTYRSRGSAPAFPSIEAQDRHDLAPLGFRVLPWVHTNVPVVDRTASWWRPVRGAGDRDAWVRAYDRCGHRAAVDRMLADLVRVLRVPPSLA